MEYLTCEVNESERCWGKAVMTMGNWGWVGDGPLQEPGPSQENGASGLSQPAVAL